MTVRGRNPARWRRLMLLVVLLASAAGCERNRPLPYLVPTGLRPRPATGTGGIVGQVIYDPAQSPDIDGPPYPPTRVSLVESGNVVAIDTLPRDQRTFAFHALPPGNYSVLVQPRLYKASSLPPVRVVADLVDVGDVIDPIDLDQLTTVSMNVSGDFNDFNDFADSCSMQQLRLGLWYGPNFDPVNTGGGDIPPDTALTLTAGVHRLRFFALSSLPTLYYGSGSSDVIDAPAADVPLALTNDTEANLSVRFPVTGRYRFYVDERRLTMTIEQLPPVATGTRRSPS